jgi:hypothetical protein
MAKGQEARSWVPQERCFNTLPRDPSFITKELHANEIMDHYCGIGCQPHYLSSLKSMPYYC